MKSLLRAILSLIQSRKHKIKNVSTQSITLPDAGTCKGKVYVISSKNKGGYTFTPPGERPSFNEWIFYIHTQLRWHGKN